MANLPPYGYGAPPSPRQFLQPPPFIPPNQTLPPPPPPPVVNYGLPPRDPNNNRFAQMINQLNFSNMSVVNLTEQMTAMQSVIDSLRMENSRLTCALEERRTNNTPLRSCSTPNGGILYPEFEINRSEYHEEIELQRNVNSASNVPVGNGRVEEDDEQRRNLNCVNNNTIGNGRDEGNVARAMRSEYMLSRQ